MRLQQRTQQGRSQDLGGGAKNFFFRFGNLHVAKRHAAHGEAMRFNRKVWPSGACPSEEIFLNSAIWCVLLCILIRFCL